MDVRQIRCESIKYAQGWNVAFTWHGPIIFLEHTVSQHFFINDSSKYVFIGGPITYPTAATNVRQWFSCSKGSNTYYNGAIPDFWKTPVKNTKYIEMYHGASLFLTLPQDWPIDASNIGGDGSGIVVVNGKQIYPTISQIYVGGTLNFTFADVAAGKLKGCLGSVCTGDATINITGTASATTDYNFSIGCSVLGNLTINFVNQATAACQSMNFSNINATQVQIAYPRAQYINIDSTWGATLTRILNATMANLTATRAYALRGINGGTIIMTATTWQTTSTYGYTAVYTAEYGTRINATNNFEQYLTNYTNLASIRYGGGVGTDGQPDHYQYLNLGGEYFRLQNVWLFPNRWL
jgi:hypothetical protein